MLSLLINMLLGALAGWFFGYFVVGVLLGGTFWAVLITAIAAGFVVGLISPGNWFSD